MNQAQQSAKWNPRDSMNFREQGAFTEGQKPLRDIQQQTERSLHRSRGVRRWRAPSLYANGGWASTDSTQVWHSWGAVMSGWRVSGNTAPIELGLGFAEPCQPHATTELRGAALGVL